MSLYRVVTTARYHLHGIELLLGRRRGQLVAVFYPLGTTSGGNIFQIQVPQSVDNVFFDANSFTAAGQSVNIDQTIVNCNSMDWTGATHNPILTGSGTNTLYIYGSLTFIAAMNNLFQGYVYFQSATTGQTINCASQIFNSYIYFNSTTGGWTLQDSLTVRNSHRPRQISAW